MDLQFPFVRIFENRNERRERRGEREIYISMLLDEKCALE